MSVQEIRFEKYHAFSGMASGVMPLSKACRLFAEIITACAQHIFLGMNEKWKSIYTFCRAISKTGTLADLFNKTDLLINPETREEGRAARIISLCCVIFVRAVSWISFLKDTGIDLLGNFVSTVGALPVVGSIVKVPLGVVTIIGSTCHIVYQYAKLQEAKLHLRTMPGVLPAPGEKTSLTEEEEELQQEKSCALDKTDNYDKKFLSPGQETVFKEGVEEILKNEVRLAQYIIAADLAKIALNVLQVCSSVMFIATAASSSLLITALCLTGATTSLIKIIASRYFASRNAELLNVERFDLKRQPTRDALDEVHSEEGQEEMRETVLASNREEDLSRAAPFLAIYKELFLGSFVR